MRQPFTAGSGASPRVANSGEDRLRFIHFPSFARQWDRLGLTDDDLRALERLIGIAPRGGPVIQGTGGLRKIRFAPRGSTRGKRGGHRVCYAYYDGFSTVALVSVYDKKEAVDLTPEDKRLLNAAIRAFQAELERGL